MFHRCILRWLLQATLSPELRHWYCLIEVKVKKKAKSREVGRWMVAVNLLLLAKLHRLHRLNSRTEKNRLRHTSSRPRTSSSLSNAGLYSRTRRHCKPTYVTYSQSCLLHERHTGHPTALAINFSDQLDCRRVPRILNDLLRSLRFFYPHTLNMVASKAGQFSTSLYMKLVA